MSILDHQSQRDKFITFLRNAGAEILAPTNPYEVVRFRTPTNGVSIIYTGRRGYKFTGEAQEAYERYSNGGKWTIRSKAQKLREKLLMELMERDDGTDCFFCGQRTYDGENMTIEHLLPISDGGNNNLKNLCIACKECNSSVDNLSIVEKIYYRDAIRNKKESPPNNQQENT